MDQYQPSDIFEIVNANCNEGNHFEAEIQALCLRKECNKSSALCFQCSMEFHTECNGSIKMLRDVLQMFLPYRDILSKLEYYLKHKNISINSKELILQIKNTLEPISQYQVNKGLRNLNQLGAFLKINNITAIMLQLDQVEQKIQNESNSQKQKLYFYQMIKDQNMKNIQCQFQNHQQLKITAICFNKDCQYKRLCCVICKSEHHRSHTEKLMEIDSLQSLLQEVSNEEVVYPQSHTFGQRQVIQNLEEFSIQIDGLQRIIKEEIEKLKKSNLQQYLKEQSNDQQGIEYWNKQIEGLLQYFEVENNLLTKKNQEQGQLSELEQKSIQIINQAKDSLNQIIKQFDKPPQNQQLKFKTDSIKLEGHTSYVRGVVISSDGAIIASGSHDKTVKLWDAKTKQLLQTFQYNSSVYEVAISSNNQYLAYGGTGDYSLQLHDLQSKNSYGTLKGHTDQIWSIAFSYDSQFIFSGGYDNKLIIWNLSQKTQIHSFETDSCVWTIVTSPDNKLISCICSSSINIWDFQTKTKLIHQQKPHSIGYGLCSSKDSSIFISSGSDGLIKIWRLNDGGNNQKSLTLTREIKAKAAGSYIWRVILTSDEKYIISICNPEKKIMIHGIESGNLIQELKYEKGGNPYGYISISNDMNVLVSGNVNENMVRIWTRE